MEISENYLVKEQNKEKLRIEYMKELIETNTIARWIHNVLMKEMDKFAYARSNIIFIVICYFLGHNLNNFLWLYIVFTCYIMILRMLRWWVLGWLLFLFEFCYLGLIGSVLYLLFFISSKEAWFCIYSASTGVMALAGVIFNNQAAFVSTDLICSCWLHAMPLITVWSIRWREYIYPASVLNSFTFKFIPLKDLELDSFEDKIKYLVICPYSLWLIWLVFYCTVFYTLLGDT